MSVGSSRCAGVLAMCRAFWANYSALLLPTMASLMESLPDDTDFKLLSEDQTHWAVIKRQQF
jgi:hypothetical protein